MKEILDLIRYEFPHFFINIFNIITQPRKYPLELIRKSNGNNEQALARALFYFFICMLFCQIWSIPIYGREDIFNLYKLIVSVFAPILLLILGTLALKISWNIVGYKSTFINYLLIFAYHAGTILNFYLLTNMVNLAILKKLDPKKFNEITGYSFLNKSQVDPSYDILSNGAYMLFTLLGLVFLILVLTWFYSAWSAYKKLNDADKWKSIWAAILFTLFMSVVFFVDIAIEKALEF
jgi:hypothetical protein